MTKKYLDIKKSPLTRKTKLVKVDLAATQAAATFKLWEDINPALFIIEGVEVSHPAVTGATDNDIGFRYHNSDTAIDIDRLNDGFSIASAQTALTNEYAGTYKTIADDLIDNINDPNNEVSKYLSKAGLVDLVFTMNTATTKTTTSELIFKIDYLEV